MYDEGSQYVSTLNRKKTMSKEVTQEQMNKMVSEMIVDRLKKSTFLLSGLCKEIFDNHSCESEYLQTVELQAWYEEWQNRQERIKEIESKKKVEPVSVHSEPDKVIDSLGDELNKTRQMVIELCELIKITSNTTLPPAIEEWWFDLIDKEEQEQNETRNKLKQLESAEQKLLISLKKINERYIELSDDQMEEDCE